MALQWAEKDQKKFDPAVFLNRLKRLGTLVNGTLQFEGFAVFESFELKTFIAEQITFDRVIPDTDRKRMVQNACIECAKSNNFNQSFFLQMVGRFHDEYLNRPFVAYNLFSSISMDDAAGLEIPKLAGCTFEFHATLPPAIDRTPLESRFKTVFHARQFPSNYLQVQVSVGGRNIEEAFECSQNSFDILRAIWNFQINAFEGTRFYAGCSAPKNNAILAGPISTLHHIDGRLVEEKFLGDLVTISSRKPMAATIP